MLVTFGTRIFSIGSRERETGKEKETELQPIEWIMDEVTSVDIWHFVIWEIQFPKLKEFYYLLFISTFSCLGSIIWFVICVTKVQIQIYKCNADHRSNQFVHFMDFTNIKFSIVMLMSLKLKFHSTNPCSCPMSHESWIYNQMALKFGIQNELLPDIIMSPFSVVQ